MKRPDLRQGGPEKYRRRGRNMAETSMKPTFGRRQDGKQRTAVDPVYSGNLIFERHTFNGMALKPLFGRTLVVKDFQAILVANILASMVGGRMVRFNL
jgi:hypothetical protein